MNSAYFGAANLTVPATDTPDFSAVTSMFRMFQDAQTLHAGVTFSGGNSTYCAAEAATARADMMSTYAWAITDGGQHCPVACNTTTVSGVTDSTDATHEAC